MWWTSQEIHANGPELLRSLLGSPTRFSSDVRC
jgi:hypothetical protein